MAQSAEDRYRAIRQREYELDVLGTLLDQIGSDGMIEALLGSYSDPEPLERAAGALACCYDDQGYPGV